MIHRLLKNQVVNALKPGYVVGIFGARRVGKTFLLNMLRDIFSEEKVLIVQGDDLDTAEILSSSRASVLERFVKSYDYLFVDEAQKIKNIGNNLKLLHDLVPDLKIVFTGSSALELYHQLGEPLTGRSIFFKLYPISQLELQENLLESKKNLEDKLIYGSYPQIINSNEPTLKKQILNSIKNGYLLKDLLELDNQKDSLFVINLLRLIAFQIGNDVSFSELARQLQVNTRTIQRYLNLLEKTFVLFSLNGYSKNLRKEVSKSPRYYFWDNGIRNVVINNFNKLNQRDDIGKLWENYCISERLKKLDYQNAHANTFFWRTYDQKEIDFIEERDGKLKGFEMKWGLQKKAKYPKDFLNAYQNAEFIIINRENYLDFIA